MSTLKVTVVVNESGTPYAQVVSVTPSKPGSVLVPGVYEFTCEAADRDATLAEIAKQAYCESLDFVKVAAAVVAAHAGRHP
jgi:hypothetical protein